MTAPRAAGRCSPSVVSRRGTAENSQWLTGAMTAGTPRGSEGQLTAFSGELRSRVHSGFPGRPSEPSVPRVQLQAVRALLDDIHEPCWAWGPTAAALHRFDGFDLGSSFHVAVLRGRNIARVGHTVHTVNAVDLVDRAVVATIPVSSPTRTLIELARSMSNEHLTRALDSATRDGGTSDEFLHRRLVALRGRGRPGLARLLKVVEGIEVTRGGHSWLEREFLVLMSRAGLPQPARQQVVGKRRNRLIRVDCRFPGTDVVVELLGYTFHRSPLQMQSDAERMNQMLLDGLRPYQFTYIDVVERPEHVVSTVRAALATPESTVRVTA